MRLLSKENMKTIKTTVYILLSIVIFSCSKNDSSDLSNCFSDQTLDASRGSCNISLPLTNQYQESISANTRTITSNSIPNHKVGLFGKIQGSLNPNAIKEQTETYEISVSPSESSQFTPLLLTSGSGSNVGPQYAFGILLNGIELDPVAAEPFPHEGMMNPNVNWKWNLEALNVNLGLDCNSAHVQPTGKYHYHGSPVLYLQNLNVTSNKMTHIGYAADGFPIYYKYAYEIALDSSSSLIEMTSSYQLKSGNRGGDGETAPCDVYNGVYSNDYEYINTLGSLDEANGRNGVTPEYPKGTYYYIITEDFPSIPRYFRGNPSDDFKIGN